MSPKPQTESQTTIAQSGGATIPVSTGFPLPGEHSNLLPVGTRLGEFELTGLVGEGGFGIVYLAYDHSLHRQVAVKEYIPASLASRGPDNSVVVISEQHREAFRAGLNSFINEARLLAQFDHPSLLKVYRFWEANGTAYMAMPYYEGITLRKAVKNLGGPPDEEWLKHLLRPLLDALSVMHEAQCFHRDIAPDNILILSSGKPVLLDFGAARRVIADMTQAPTIILKPGYAPVEQYGEEPSMRQGAWTDVYALSAVIYSAIVGKAPQASISRFMADGLKPLSSLVAEHYSAQFLAAIDQGLAVKPIDRPQSVVAFRAALGLGDRRQRPRPTMPTLAPGGLPHGGAPPPAPGADSNPSQRPAAQPAEPAPLRAGDAFSAGDPGVSLESRLAPVRAAAGPIVVYLISGIVLAAAIGAAVWYWLLRPRPAPVVRPAESPAVFGSPAERPIAPPPPASQASVPPTTISPPTAEPLPPAVEVVRPPEKPVEPLPPVAPPQPMTSAELFAQVVARAMPGRAVAIAVESPQVVIGKGVARFSVSSASPGYLYVLRLGPGQDEVQLVFPNLADQMNRIAPGKPLALPSSSWAKPVAAPAGIERYVALVSEEPRDFGLIDARNRGPFKSFRPESLRSLQRSYVGGDPLLTGVAVCPAGVPCSPAYGASEFSVEKVIALPATAPVAEQPKVTSVQEASRPSDRQVENRSRPLHTPANEAAASRRPGASGRCSDILERASLGESLTPDQMAYLKKECGQ